MPNQVTEWGVVLGLGCTCSLLGTERLLSGTGHLIPETGHLGLGTGHLSLGPDDALILWTGAGSLGRMILAQGLGLPFFALRMTGTGDTKVMGLIAAYMGMRDGTRATAAGLCLGAVLALGKILLHDSVFQRFLYLSTYIRRMPQSKNIEPCYRPQRDGSTCVIPLGVYLFVGILLMVSWKE